MAEVRGPAQTSGQTSGQTSSETPAGTSAPLRCNGPGVAALNCLLGAHAQSVAVARAQRWQQVPGGGWRCALCAHERAVCGVRRG